MFHDISAMLVQLHSQTPRHQIDIYVVMGSSTHVRGRTFVSVHPYFASSFLDQSVFDQRMIEIYRVHLHRSDVTKNH